MFFEIGEICVCGLVVFMGYYNNLEVNVKVFKYDWFYIGDFGYVDKDGFFYIIGCFLDMYILGGFNVYLCEIEEVLLMYLVVFEVVVLGVFDFKWGESGLVVIVCKVG